MNEQTRRAARLWTLAVPSVSAFVASLVRDFQDRDDVLQETAVAVLDAFDRYDPSYSFVGWAIGIARNQVRLHYRRKARAGPAFDSDTVEALATAFADDEQAERRLEFLADCLKGLDARSRELCRMRYDDDLKPAAIGERLGLAANTVAKALQRVRDRLRECVERKSAAAEAGA